MYAIYTDGAIFGIGETLNEAIRDAKEWLDVDKTLLDVNEHLDDDEQVTDIADIIDEDYVNAGLYSAPISQALYQQVKEEGGAIAWDEIGGELVTLDEANN